MHIKIAGYLNRCRHVSDAFSCGHLCSLPSRTWNFIRNLRRNETAQRSSTAGGKGDANQRRPILTKVESSGLNYKAPGRSSLSREANFTSFYANTSYRRFNRNAHVLRNGRQKIAVQSNQRRERYDNNLVGYLTEFTNAVPTNEASGMKAYIPLPSFAIPSSSALSKLYPNPKVPIEAHGIPFCSLYLFSIGRVPRGGSTFGKPSVSNRIADMRPLQNRKLADEIFSRITKSPCKGICV
jgi:hypothetical protein